MISSSLTVFIPCSKKVRRNYAKRFGHCPQTQKSEYNINVLVFVCLRRRRLLGRTIVSVTSVMIVIKPE